MGKQAEPVGCPRGGCVGEPKTVPREPKWSPNASPHGFLAVTDQAPRRFQKGPEKANERYAKQIVRDSLTFVSGRASGGPPCGLDRVRLGAKSLLLRA